MMSRVMASTTTRLSPSHVHHHPPHRNNHRRKKCTPSCLCSHAVALARVGQRRTSPSPRGRCVGEPGTAAAAAAATRLYASLREDTTTAADATTPSPLPASPYYPPPSSPSEPSSTSTSTAKSRQRRRREDQHARRRYDDAGVVASVVITGLAAAELGVIALDLQTTHVMAGVDAAVHQAAGSSQQSTPTHSLTRRDDVAARVVYLKDVFEAKFQFTSFNHLKPCAFQAHGSNELINLHRAPTRFVSFIHPRLLRLNRGYARALCASQTHWSRDGAFDCLIIEYPVHT